MRAYQVPRGHRYFKIERSEAWVDTYPGVSPLKYARADQCGREVTTRATQICVRLTSHSSRKPRSERRALWRQFPCVVGWEIEDTKGWVRLRGGLRRGRDTGRPPASLSKIYLSWKSFTQLSRTHAASRQELLLETLRMRRPPCRSGYPLCAKRGRFRLLRRTCWQHREAFCISLFRSV